jgi:intein/homing endonuclease
VYKKVFVDFLKSRFSKLSKKRSNKDIDDEILALPNKKLGLFVRGLFDAEGYVDKSYIGIRMTNENVIRKLHLILIRFNIVSSLNGPDKFRRYQIRITNPLYIRNFEKEIGFSSVRKMIKLQSILKEYKRGMSSRVPISGIFIRKLIEDN